MQHVVLKLVAGFKTPSTTSCFNVGTDLINGVGERAVQWMGELYTALLFRMVDL
jgi:hypothetical protein